MTKVRFCSDHSPPETDSPPNGIALALTVPSALCTPRERQRETERQRESQRETKRQTGSALHTCLHCRQPRIVHTRSLGDGKTVGV